MCSAADSHYCIISKLLYYQHLRLYYQQIIVLSANYCIISNFLCYQQIIVYQQTTTNLLQLHLCQLTWGVLRYKEGLQEFESKWKMLIVVVTHMDTMEHNIQAPWHHGLTWGGCPI